ncbi:MAG: 4'-phosphopantetheinyl transferase superfamily protein [Cytophagales bacterium]|nr:4'-phosphopantetheinyl transferase superfamily protein [Bernardetiaceae bacterium]MDW8210213.1 4'-phosphopantetheinyl transferase superfamily protein [Cytophagales bacterium]
MPLVKKVFIENYAVWGIWQIDENIDQLHEFLATLGVSYSCLHIQAVEKRKESLAARALAHVLARDIQLNTGKIVLDRWGSPCWECATAALSLSHTRGFAAAFIHCSATSCGIDIERPTPRLLKVATRVFSPQELAWADNRIEQLTVLWCAKEALYKWYKVGHLDFRTHIAVHLQDHPIRGLVHHLQPHLQYVYSEPLVVAYCWL